MTERVKVPQYLADWFEKEDFYNRSLYVVLKLAQELEREDNDSVYFWYNTQSFISAQQTLAKMWLYGCEVEEERFYWRKKKEHLLFFENKPIATFINLDTEENTIILSDKYESESFRTKFTVREVINLLGDEDFKKLERVEIGKVED